MKSRRLFAAILSLLVFIAIGAAVILAPGNVEATGQAIYADNCASCHGADLQGQPNWQTRLPNGRFPAPPHDATGHTWHHSDDDLFAIVKFGLSAVVQGVSSDMPAFSTLLSDYQITAVLEFIKGTWPRDERAYQELQTANQ